MFAMGDVPDYATVIVRVLCPIVKKGMSMKSCIRG